MIKRLHSNLFLVSDIARTAEFYKKLGFNVQVSDDAVRIKPGDFTFAFIDEAKARARYGAQAGTKGAGIFSYVEVDDVDAHYAMATANGIAPETEPTSYPYGKREYTIKDLDGFKMVFYTPA